jgi:hypothetical protein
MAHRRRPSSRTNLLRNDEDRVCARSTQPSRASVDRSSTDDRHVWPSLFQTVGGASHGVPRLGHARCGLDAARLAAPFSRFFAVSPRSPMVLPSHRQNHGRLCGCERAVSTSSSSTCSCAASVGGSFRGGTSRPWPRPQTGGWLVQLMLESGKPVTLRADDLVGIRGDRWWPRTSRTITASNSGGSRTAVRPGAR